MKHIDSEIKEHFETCRTVTTGQYEKNDVIYAIEVSGGYYNTIARLLGKSRASVKNFIEKDKELSALIEEMQEGILDDIERKVHEQAKDGDGANARFVLLNSRKGKSRGYSSKQEIQGNLGVDPALSAILERVAERGTKLTDNE